MQKLLIAAAAAAASFISIGSVAHAAESSVQVRYNDLNLARAEGAAALRSRIQSAVVQVCGTADPRDLEEDYDMTKCRKNASARANADADHVISGARASVTVVAVN